MLFEGVESLSAQRDAVHKEKDPLHMSGSRKGVYQGDTSPGLAGPGGHDKEEPAAVLFNAVHNRPDGLELKIAACDSGVNQLIGERLLVLPEERQTFEVLPRGETMDLLGRGFAKVPKKISCPFV